MRPLIAILGFAWAATCVAAEPSCSYRAGAATIDLPGAPFAAEPSADGCWLYVSLGHGRSPGRGAVAVLHNDEGAFVMRRAVPLDGDPAGLGLTQDGGRLLVADGAGISILDVARLQAGDADPLLGRIPLGVGTIYLAITRDDRTVFASVEREARIAVIDLARVGDRAAGAEAVIGSIPAGTAPVGLALSGKGDRLYATSESAPRSLGLEARCLLDGGRYGDRRLSEGLLSVIDVARARVDPAAAILATWRAGCSPVRVILGPDDKVAWVSARGEDAVYRFDLGSNGSPGATATLRRFAVGSAPVGLALAPSGDALWISNSNRFSRSEPGTLERIDLLDGSRTVLPSGRFPRDLRFLPDGRTLVVAVFGSSQLQLVPPPPREPAR